MVFRGYRTALQEAGRAFNPSLVCNVMNNGPALRAVNKLFDDEHPDGFFCFNDARAWYVYGIHEQEGLTVGKDISVVGVDNHHILADALEPQLTTIRTASKWAIGQPELISMIEGKDVDTSSCPSARASLPPLDAPIPAKIQLALLEKDSRHILIFLFQRFKCLRLRAVSSCMENCAFVHDTQ